jgi:hypothetical protein
MVVHGHLHWLLLKQPFAKSSGNGAVTSAEILYQPLEEGVSSEFYGNSRHALVLLFFAPPCHQLGDEKTFLNPTVS